MFSWKVIALALSGVASAISLVSTVVEDKRRAEQIEEEVAKAFEKREGKVSE